MPIAVGIQPTKTNIDATVGAICLNTLTLIEHWNQVYNYFVSLADGDLTDLGYDADGITAVRALQARALEMVNALTGQGVISVTHDYRVEMSEWWGTGLTSGAATILL